METPGASRKPAARNMADILDLPDGERNLVTWMLRQTHIQLRHASAFLGQDEASTRRILNTLVEKGFLQECIERGEPHYRVCVASQPRRPVNAQLWKPLDG